jgi:transposase
MKPISKDLRNRVINHLEKGNSYVSASIKFEVSQSSARIWHRRYVSVNSSALYDWAKSLVSKLYGRIARNSFSLLAL